MGAGAPLDLCPWDKLECEAGPGTTPRPWHGCGSSQISTSDLFRDDTLDGFDMNVSLITRPPTATQTPAATLLALATPGGHAASR